MCFRIDGDILVDSLEHTSIHAVFRLLDNHLLACDVALHAQTQYAHEEEAVGVNVEDRRVAVGLIREEDCQRCQYYRGYAAPEPYGPVVITGHTHACHIQQVEYQEHNDRHDDRHTQSAFSDNSSQWCTDKEEDDT